MKPLFILLLISPFAALAQTAISLNAGVIPNVVSYSDNPFGGGGARIGGFARLKVSRIFGLVEPALVAESGILGHIEAPYIAAGMQFDFYLSPKRSVYIGPGFKYLYADGKDGIHKGVDIGIYTGWNKRIAPKIVFNAEGGFRFIRVSEDITIPWGHHNGGAINYERKHFDRVDILAIPISAGLKVEL